VDAQTGLGIGFEGFGDHDGAEVRPTDADVHDVGDGLAAISFPGAGADGIGELAHVREDGVDAGHDVLAIDVNGAIGSVAEGDVKNGAVFGDVDLVSAEHAIAPFLDFGLSGKIEKKAQGLVGDAVFGKIQENVVEAEGELLKSLRVLSEEVAHV